MKTAPANIALAIAAHVSTLDASAAAAGTWVQLVPAGKFSARDGRGPFDAGGHASLQAIVQRTRQIAGATDLVIDYDHQSVFGAVEGVGGRAPAAGWIKQLEVRGDGIWGQVQWTDAAAAAIRSGEYRYLSPVFHHEKKSGRVLLIRMAGLTNTPALDLAEVAAASFLKLSETGDPMDKIAAALGLAAGSDGDAVLAALNTVLANGTACAKALGLKDGATPDDVLTAVNSVVADRAKIVAAAGQKADASTDDVVTVVAAALKGAAPDPARFVPIEGFNELQARLKKLEDATAGEAAETAVATAIKDGKLMPSMKDWGLGLFKSDRKAFDEFVGAAPKLTAPQLAASKKPGADDGALSEAEAHVAAVLGVDPKAMAKTLADEAKQKEAR